MVSRFQDHAQLFNDHLIRNQRRKDAIDQLKEMGGTERTLVSCFTRLRQYHGKTDGTNPLVGLNEKYALTLLMIARF